MSDGPHSDNRGVDNRGAPTTPVLLRPQAGAPTRISVSIMPLAALCGPLPGAALLFAPLKRCAWSPVVRPCLPPVRRAQHHSLVCCGYSCSAHRLLHGVGASTTPLCYGAPTLCIAPPRCPKLSSRPPDARPDVGENHTFVQAKNVTFVRRAVASRRPSYKRQANPKEVRCTHSRRRAAERGGRRWRP